MMGQFWGGSALGILGQASGYNRKEVDGPRPSTLSLSEGEKLASLGKLRDDFLALRKEAGRNWPGKEFGR